MNYQYFEIDFEHQYAICIKGVREPTIEEARQFLAKDIERLESDVIRVTPIHESEARNFYDFSHVDDWPVFGV